jgi:hypothetical protein
MILWNSEEVFMMQAKVAGNVARYMNLPVTDTDVAAVQKMPTENREAYNLYLQAQFPMQKYNDTSLKKAIPLYEKAIALDSNFVESYIGLAHLWDTMGWWGF